MKNHSGTVNTTLACVTGAALLGYGICLYVYWEIDQMMKGKWKA